MRTKRTTADGRRYVATNEQNGALVADRRAEGELENVRGAARASCALFHPARPLTTHSCVAVSAAVRPSPGVEGTPLCVSAATSGTRVCRPWRHGRQRNAAPYRGAARRPARQPKLRGRRPPADGRAAAAAAANDILTFYLFIFFSSSTSASTAGLHSHTPSPPSPSPPVGYTCVSNRITTVVGAHALKTRRK